MRTQMRPGAILMLGATLLVSGSVLGQVMRDPTQPPAAFMTQQSTTRTPNDDFKFEQLVTVSGVRYVVWNSRRYKVGDNINGARIERITENSIWLKNAGTVRMVQLFPSIEQRPSGNGAQVGASNRNSMDSKDGTKK